MTSTTKNILGLGNVILDLTIPVKLNYLERHDLPINSQIIVKNQQQKAILDDVVANKKAVITTGGCCVNTLKFMHKIREEKDKQEEGSSVSFNTCFLGRIGDPTICKYTKIYSEKIKNQIDNLFLIPSSQKKPIGMAAGLTYKENRCLLANLGAVEEGLTDTKIFENYKIDIDNYHLVYAPGMFLGSSGIEILRM